MEISKEVISKNEYHYLVQIEIKVDNQIIVNICSPTHYAERSLLLKQTIYSNADYVNYIKDLKQAVEDCVDIYEQELYEKRITEEKIKTAYNKYMEWDGRL